MREKSSGVVKRKGRPTKSSQRNKVTQELKDRSTLPRGGKSTRTKKNAAKTNKLATKERISSKSSGKTSRKCATTSKGRSSRTSSSSLGNKITSRRTLSRQSNQRKTTSAKSCIPPYRELKQNLYRAPLSRSALKDDDTYVCNCQPIAVGSSSSSGGEGDQRIIKGCGASCQNRLIYVECVPSLCPCTRQSYSKDYDQPVLCENTVIQTGRFPGTEVYKTKKCGYALRLLEDVPQNTIIVEYRGEVITQEEMTLRMSKYKATDNFYFASLGGGLLLDADKMGSVARFANHSCEPTCTLQRWTVLGEPRIVLVSNCDLTAGTEITYKYGYHDDGFKNNPIRAQACHCGSKFCAGTVGGAGLASLSEVNNALAKAETLLTSNKATTESIEKFIEASSSLIHLSPPLKKSVQALKKTLDRAKQWQAQYIALFSEPKPQEHMEGKHFVTVEYINDLLEKSPAEIRLDEEKTVLQGMIKAAESARMAIDELRQKRGGLDHKMDATLESTDDMAGVLSVELTSAGATTVSSVTSIEPPPLRPASAGAIKNRAKTVEPIHWDEYIRVIKLADDALPIRCDHVEWLLELFVDLSKWYSRWFSHLITVDISPAMSKYCSMLKRLCKMYSNSANIVFPDHLFRVYSFLDHNLSLQIIRQDQAQEQPPRLKPLKPLKPNPADARNNREELHCYCRLPELYGQYKVMCQCSSCDEWFHLQCNNAPPRLADQAEEVNWICATCAFARNELNSFVFSPSSEWNLVKDTLQAVVAPSVKRKRVEEGTDGLSNPSRPMDAAIDELSNLVPVAAEAAKPSEDSTNDPDPALGSSAPSPQERLREMLSNKLPGRSRYFLNDNDIHKILAEAAGLAISQVSLTAVTVFIRSH